MRILHVYRTFFPDTQGGLEEVIRQICAGTKALGAENRIFTTTKKINEPAVLLLDEATVYRSRETFELASCNVSFSGVADFRRQVEWCDIIHYHFPWPFADFLNLITEHSKPVVITYHSDIVRQKLLLSLYGPLMRKFLRSADRIICTSPNYFATSTALTEFESKVDVIPIGISRESYPPLLPSVLRRAEKDFGRDFFLFVGVLRYYKGLHILLEAIENTPYRVVIVGSGPTEEKLKAQARELNLKNVIFAGHVSNEEKVALFELSRAIVFPSYLRSEAFGVTLLEGAMFGKPLISAEVGSGTSHVNIHGDTGLVVAPASARALRKALRQLHEDTELANDMGKRAKQRFEKLFNGELMCRRYWQVYAELSELPEQPMPFSNSNSV